MCSCIWLGGTSGLNTFFFLHAAPAFTGAAAWVACASSSCSLRLGAGGAVAFILLNLRRERSPIGASGAVCGVFARVFPRR